MLKVGKIHYDDDDDDKQLQQEKKQWRMRKCSFVCEFVLTTHTLESSNQIQQSTTTHTHTHTYACIYIRCSRTRLVCVGRTQCARVCVIEKILTLVSVRFFFVSVPNEKVLSAVGLLFSDQFSSLKTDIDGYERKRIKIYAERKRDSSFFFSSMFSRTSLYASYTCQRKKANFKEFCCVIFL